MWETGSAEYGGGDLPRSEESGAGRLEAESRPRGSFFVLRDSGGAGEGAAKAGIYSGHGHRYVPFASILMMAFTSSLYLLF